MNLNKGLVGHWTMDDSDTSGGILSDRSAYDNHGTIDTNVTTGISAPVGDGFRFVGDKIININAEPIGTSSFTFSFWLKGDFANSSKNYPDVFNGFWGRGAGDSTASDSGFRIDSDSTSRYIQGFIYDGSFSTWTHIAISVDQDIGEAHFYENGTHFHTNTFTTGENISDSISFFGNDDLNMDISEFRYYKRALSQDEINALYQMRSQRQQKTSGFLRERFESNSFGDRWDVTNATISNSRSYVGTYSFGSWGEGGVEARYTVEPNGSQKINSFEYVWKEDASQTGHVVILYDQNGNEVQESGTENYQWMLNDGSGGRVEISGNVSGGGYNQWTRFRFEFDWVNNQYDYHLEDLEGGHTETGTQSLDSSTGVSEIRFTGSGYGTANHCRFDDIQVN